MKGMQCDEGSCIAPSQISLEKQRKGKNNAGQIRSECGDCLCNVIKRIQGVSCASTVEEYSLRQMFVSSCKRVNILSIF